MKRLARSAHLAAVSFTLALSAQADTLVVASDGSGDFPTIAAAVGAASNGDTLLVRSGSYPGFAVNNKGLKIVAEASPVLVSSSVTLSHDNQRVVLLAGLEISGQLSITGGGGTHVHECTIYGPGHFGFAPPPALVAVDVPGLIVTRSTILGGDGLDENLGCPGLRVSSSNVALYSSLVVGGDGYDQGTSFPVVAGAGGAGIEVLDGSTVVQSGGASRGGEGGDYNALDLPGWGGDGGAGVQSQLGTLVATQRVGFFGGVGGDAAAGSTPGSNGQGFAGEGELRSLPGAARRMLVDRYWDASVAQSVTLIGQPGDSVFLARGESAGFEYVESLNGAWSFDGADLNGEFLGTLPPSGILSVEIDLGPYVEGRTVYQQPYFVSGPNTYLGTPDSRVLLHDPGTYAYCSAEPNSTGAAATLSSSGSTSLAAEDLTITASGAVPSQFGIFYYGPQNAAAPFGEGLRCVQGSSFRLPPQAIDASGSASLSPDYQSLPFSAGPGEVQAGTSWFFQFWYRDPAGGPSGFNLSDGLQVSFEN